MADRSPADDVLRLDSAALAVLAHPLRSRLLSELRLHGAATATELAERLDTNTGATSYHLRKLESVGLVVDTGTGTGKRRVWDASTRGHGWQPSDFAGDDAAEHSLAWLHRHYVAQLAAHAGAWFDVERTWPGAWRDALGYGDEGVVVTSEQARAMRDEIEAVVHRYRDLGEQEPDAERLLVGTIIVPVEPRAREGGR
jgi:DNA-binding Lrp family transcriptional regulator